MLRTSLLSLLIIGTLSACGHTPQERAASGALIGATAGALVGLASLPGRGDYRDNGYESVDYHHERKERRHRHRGEWQYYD